MGFNTASNGGWFNPAGATAWHKMANKYEAMSTKVTAAATHAVDTHITEPAKAAFSLAGHQDVADALKVHEVDGNHQLGAPGNDRLGDLEYGTLEKAPQPLFSNALRAGRDAAVTTFHERLAAK